MSVPAFAGVGDDAALIARRPQLSQIERRLAPASCVLRDAPLWGAPQDEEGLCVALKAYLILRKPRSGCLEGRTATCARQLCYCSAPTRPVKKARPSVPPSRGSVAFSGCGIRPRIVR